MQIFFLTSLALLAFAANSVLCRLALGEGLIDATSFTAIRLVAGMLMLVILIAPKQHLVTVYTQGHWFSATLLFTYAATFSYAYITLDTATGALILFGAVQITMLLAAMRSGYRLSALEWGGMALSMMGFVYLMLPDAKAPSWSGFLLMLASGIAWAYYTLRGRACAFPLMDTTANFLRTIPLLTLLLLVFAHDISLSIEGVLYAILSGALASGLGYTLWYMVLPQLASIRAAVLQLLVPVLAASGGLLFVAEPITLSFITAATMILGGILMVIFAKKS
ncbi:MAG: EamA family transporter [Zetaproteobacteria bacterium CG2_30_46_52]|nr:MAG: EamA family transporter [Zetaproteobacteria bacterium CG2_30_46_52]